MNVTPPKVAHPNSTVAPLRWTDPLGKVKGGDGRVQVAEAKSKQKYAGLAAHDKKFEDFAIALTGKTAEQRTPDENRALVQLRKEMADGTIDPAFVEADPANGAGDDKLPPRARGAFVKGAKGAQGRVLISGTLRGQQLQNTSDEEQGEAVSDRARQLGIGVADGDAGARVSGVANGRQVTRQSDAALFRDHKSDTITVIADGKRTVAEADAGQSSRADASSAPKRQPTAKTLPVVIPTTPAEVSAKAAPPSTPASALDTLKTLVKDKDPAATALLQALMGAKSDDEMNRIIAANPSVFPKAIQLWAKANGLTGKITEDTNSQFLSRLTADMGFGTSSAKVADGHLILLVGGDNRINATVSAIGQMIFEKHGEAAWQDYRAKIEADWGADGTFSDETLTLLDDVLSTAKANYKPFYDSTGKLLTAAPDVRVAQQYIQLGKKYGGIDAATAYNDLAAQVHFQSGKDMITGGNGAAPTPASDLLNALQSKSALDAAQNENQRKFDTGEITRGQFVETGSFLSAQTKKTVDAVKKAATAAGLDPALMLRPGMAEGFILALTDFATADKVVALGQARMNSARLRAQINGMFGAGKNLDHPETMKLVAKIKEADVQIAKLEAELKAKGIDVTDDLKSAHGDGFAALAAGVAIARDGGLDKAHSTEKTASKNGAAPTYAELFAKIDLLATTRAELAKVDADEAANVITPWLANKRRAELPVKIAALEAELSDLAKANNLAADTFTNPTKAKGYMTAAKNADMVPLILAWRQKKAQLAQQEAELAKMLGAGTYGEALDQQSAKVIALREELKTAEAALYDSIQGADPAAASKLAKKRTERDAALAAFNAMPEDGPDPEARSVAHSVYVKLNIEVKALEAKSLPANIDVIADGAMAAKNSGADAGWRIETDPAFKAGYMAVATLSKDQMTSIQKFTRSLDAALADGKITDAERMGLVGQYRDVAAFMPRAFFGDVTATMPPQDPSWDAILTRSKALLSGSFADGASQRLTEIQAENEKMLLAADVPVLLAELTKAAQGQLTGQSATAHTQYVLQMLGVSFTQKELDTFLNGGALPAAKQKAMLLAAKFFAQSQGQKVDDTASLKILRTALSGDMGRSTSDHKVGKWEEFTFAGTDNPDVGPATPQTELLRSVLSVLHEIYAEVHPGYTGELDREVPPRMYDGVITQQKETTWAGGPRGAYTTDRDYYALDEEHWNPETGQITGLKDQPTANIEWSFEAILIKQIAPRGPGGKPVFKTERINPQDQAKIAQLKADGYAIIRVEAKPASEPQRMMGRLLEGLATYMKTYKPTYDANGKLTNPSPLARIAQYYVQTEFAADSSDHPDGNKPLTNYRIEQTKIVMTDAEAIRFMFNDLGLPAGDIDALLGASGPQLGTSSALHDPESTADKIVFTVVDSVFTFGLMSLFKGLIDKTTTDPLTDFGNDRLGDTGRDNWRSSNRDKMDDPSVFSLVFDTLMFAVPEVFGGFVFTAGATAGRLAKTGSNVADAAVDASRAGPGTIWDIPDADLTTLRGLASTGKGKNEKTNNLFDQMYGGNPPDFTIQAYMVGAESGEIQPLLHGLRGSSSQDVELATFVPQGGPRDVAPPLADGRPGPTTPNIYKWEAGVTFDAPPPGTRLAETTTRGIYTAKDAAGKTVHYAKVVGPDGKATYVRVDGIKIKEAEAAKPAVEGRAADPGQPYQPAVIEDLNANPPVIGRAAIPARNPTPAVTAQPAVAAKPAEYEWHIYNPTEGASPVKNMPKLEWVADTNSWRMVDTTALNPGDYDKLVAGGAYVSKGRGEDAGLLPGMATNELVSSIRGGDGWGAAPLTDPVAFSTSDPLSLLTKNGRIFLEKNPVREAAFLSDFKSLQNQNENLQQALQTAKERNAFWESATVQLEKFRGTNAKLTWKDLQAQNPKLAEALERAGLTRRTGEILLDDSSIDTLLAGTRRERDAAFTKMTDTEAAIIANTRTLDGKLGDINGEGHGNKTRSPRYVLRNGAVGLVAVLTGGGTLAGVAFAINKKPDPAKDPFEKTENIALGQDAEQKIDVAGLTATKGKGYTYELTSDFLINRGVTINKTTGEVIVNSKAGSSLVPGGVETFSVLIKDAKGATVGKLTITVTVDDGKISKPVVLTTGKLSVTPGTPATFDVATQAALPASKDYVYELDSANPATKGVTVNGKTGLLTVDAKDGSDLKPDKSYDIAVLVKNAAGVTVGKMTVTIAVGAKK